MEGELLAKTVTSIEGQGIYTFHLLSESNSEEIIISSMTVKEGNQDLDQLYTLSKHVLILFLQ